MKTVRWESSKIGRDAAPTARDDLRHPAPRWLMAIIATSLSAGMLMAAVVPGWIGANPGEVESGRNQPPATRSRDALPLYQLPPISVVADRKAELAKIERDERAGRMNQARTKTAMKPPV